MCHIDPAWGQFFTGLAALIVSIVALLSNKQIKELIKLNKEQKKQSDALIEQNSIFRETLEIDKKRYGHEAKKIKQESRPFFRKELETPSGPNKKQLILTNDGSNATDIKIEDGAINGATWNVAQQPSNKAKKAGKIAIDIYSGDETFEGISFHLTYKSEDDIQYSQRIFKEQGNNFKVEKIDFDDK